jgi:transposase
MNEEIFVGLDVHRKSIVATVLDGMGNTIDSSQLGSSDNELVQYLDGLEGTKRVILEACSVWEHVYDAAESTGASMTLAHPSKTRLIAEASLKSDKVDSRALAELLRVNAVPKAYAPEKPVRALRQLVRDRQYYKHAEGGVKNHVYSILLRRGTEYEDGILGMIRKRESLRELKIPAVDRGLDVLASIHETCKELDTEIHQAFSASKEAQLLATIPGIGELTAVTLVAELCPIDRFSNVEKVSSYAGLVPTVHQSGETSYHGRLKKDSNGVLKTVLIEAAWMHLRYDKKSDVSKKGKRVTRRAGKMRGVVAAAHQLLKVVYAVLKRGTPYTPERPGRDLIHAKP